MQIQQRKKQQLNTLYSYQNLNKSTFIIFLCFFYFLWIFREVPLPFSSNSNIEFHSSSEKSKIVVEKQNRVTVPGMLSPNSGSKSMSSMPSPPSQANVSAAMQPVPVKDTSSLHSTKDAQVGRAL